MGQGGAERVISIIANYLVDRDYKVEIVTFADSVEDFYSLNENVKRHWLIQKRSGIFGFLFLLLNFRKYLRRERYDIAISFLTVPNVLTILASLGLNDLKLVVSERGNPMFDTSGYLFKWAMKFLYHIADALVVQTKDVEIWMRANLFNSTSLNVKVVPNPVDIDDSILSRHLYTRKIEDKFLIMACGRLVPSKGYSVLIRAIKLLVECKIEVRCVIVGDGPQKRYLEKLVSSLNLSDVVELVGKVKNVETYYRDSDLFVLSSFNEGFPNVLLEAMSFGLPCVSFDCDYGPRAIIVDQVNGCLAGAPGNEGELFKVIRELIQNTGLRRSIALEAKKAGGQYSKDIIMQSWLEIFDSIGNEL